MSLRKFSRLCSICRQVSGNATTHFGFQPPSKVLSHKSHKLTPARAFSLSQDSTVDMSDYPAEVEVSYDDFKYVERILPRATVPEIPKHSSYPTPSGWVPPNEELRSQQLYLVRRTKNHVLPVYPGSREVWKQVKHHVVIKNVEGDIWKLESELRQHLQNTTETNKIITQVHEVSRCLRIRGEHRAEIAQFLLDRGM